MSNVHF